MIYNPIYLPPQIYEEVKQKEENDFFAEFICSSIAGTFYLRQGSGKDFCAG